MRKPSIEEEDEDEEGYRNQQDELLSNLNQFLVRTVEARTTREDAKLKVMQIKQLESPQATELAKPDTDAKKSNLKKLDKKLMELTGLGDLGLE